MIALFRSIFLAALLCAGTASAQSDTPVNPHSTKAKDKQATSGSTGDQDTQSAESANPHSVDRHKDASKAQGNPSQQQIDQAESENTNSTEYGKHGHGGSMAGMDHDGMMMKNASPQMMLQALHMANQEEIKMGKLAEDKGTDRVKSYAKTLQDDHSAADRQVKDLAQKKGWTLSDTPRNERMQHHQQAMMDRLDHLQGSQFDRTFANRMVNGHQRLIRMARNWSQNANDPEVKGLLDQMMPKLQQHEQMAEQLRTPAAQGRSPDVR
ncbi:MAG TPA: DUF4142 domain-containing protein [Myxococcales bacterium]